MAGVVVGVNDLATTHPDLAAQLLDQTLATKLSAGSNKKVDWYCSAHGHVWAATVYDRAKGKGCPYCSGRFAIVGETDLATLQPDLAAELVDETLATKLTASSHKSVDWSCKAHGHVWAATVGDRSRGRGCPFCAGKAVLAGFNDLATTHPDLAAELVDQTLATQLGFGSGKKVKWRCATRGHVWDAVVGSRSTGIGCAYCSGRFVIVGETDLATTHPDLAAELVDQTLATQRSAGSNKPVEWSCKAHGHNWPAPPARRVEGKGCPYCAGRAVLVEFNDLATLRPELAAELVDQSLATKLTISSGKVVEWSCKAHGHNWATRVADREAGLGCPYCSGKAVLAGFNDLATTHPGLAAELVDQSLATKLNAGSNKAVEWSCKAYGHGWRTNVNNRRKGTGCPVCIGKAVLAGFNDLATTHPDLAAELVDPTLATQLGFGSGKSVEWSCKAHRHVWEAAVSSRSSGIGCPYCSGNSLMLGFNDLATTHPDLAAELVDQSVATEHSFGTHRKAKWRCKAQGHVWEAEIVSRSSGIGCPECATTGFSQVGIGWLYLLATPGRRVFKFGITNDLETRLDKHSKQGFTVLVEERLYEYGGDALKIETALLRHKKAMGWQHGMAKADMPDGYSETLLADDCGDDFTLSGFIATLPDAND